MSDIIPKCKCGVEWASMLYGSTCGRCGDKRPKVNFPKNAIADAVPSVDRQTIIAAQRQEIKELHESIDSIFFNDNKKFLELACKLDIKSTAVHENSMDLENLRKVLETQANLEKEHNEILKEVAQILIANHRQCPDGNFIVYMGEVDFLYKQVKAKRELSKHVMPSLPFMYKFPERSQFVFINGTP